MVAPWFISGYGRGWYGCCYCIGFCPSYLQLLFRDQHKWLYGTALAGSLELTHSRPPARVRGKIYDLRSPRCVLLGHRDGGCVRACTHSLCADSNQPFAGSFWNSGRGKKNGGSEMVCWYILWSSAEQMEAGPEKRVRDPSKSEGFLRSRKLLYDDERKNCVRFWRMGPRMRIHNKYISPVIASFGSG